MSNLLLISDANILIDLVDGEIIGQFFELDYKFAVPDVLYREELQYSRHDLIDGGLLVKELTAEAILDTVFLLETYSVTGVSSNDCMALALARQENCPLLTGDKALRKVSLSENTIVRGTLWIVGEMLDSELLTVDEAEQSYKLMQERGSRLPWNKVTAQLNKYRIIGKLD